MPDLSSVRGVLVDLAGVLYDGQSAYPRAAEAVTRLHDRKLPVRYVTNTTRSTRADLVAKLHALGLPIPADEIFTAPLAAKAVLAHRGLRPLLLVHPNLLPDFADVETAEPNAVVVGDAGDALSYSALNAAFRLLMDGAPLIAMARNRYFREPDGLSLDAGPFVAALEFAAGVKAEVVGKPAAEFFQLGLDDLGCSTAEAVMIGDDVENDVLGAAAAGLHGILVRTGKYQPGDDGRLSGSMSSDRADVVDDFPAAVERILSGG